MHFWGILSNDRISEICDPGMTHLVIQILSSKETEFALIFKNRDCVISNVWGNLRSYNILLW